MKTEQDIIELMIKKAIQNIPSNLRNDEREIALVAAKTITRYNGFRHAIRKHQLQLQKLEKEYRNEQRIANTELEKTQALCKHESTTYFPDAAGGSDSSTICDICDKEL